MSLIQKHFDKNNLHHAYLIEGDKDNVVPEIVKFCEDLNVETADNPDFCIIKIDNFKMEEAINLRGMGNERGISPGKKIFVVCSNSITLDAQGTLLKMFEEPIENTHFFLVVPDVNSLLKTLVSRFYLIRNENADIKTKEAEQFLNMPLKNRIDFIKELLAEPEEENDERDSEVAVLDSTRSKALKFLNALELTLHKKFISSMSRTVLDMGCFEHLFKVREFLRMPGSSTKTLMESVALIIPNL
ncbi:MAG TPA: hypothetical protein VK675_03995 [Candidatus Paceibacterota bacterium]|nr:hypothetical protein [Candidatus Paceibacterota bacterium]